MAIYAIYILSIKSEKDSENGPILIRIREKNICANTHKGTLDQASSDPKSPAPHTTVCSVPLLMARPLREDFFFFFAAFDFLPTQPISLPSSQTLFFCITTELFPSPLLHLLSSQPT